MENLQNRRDFCNLEEMYTSKYIRLTNKIDQSKYHTDILQSSSFPSFFYFYCGREAGLKIRCGLTTEPEIPGPNPAYDSIVLELSALPSWPNTIVLMNSNIVSDPGVVAHTFKPSIQKIEVDRI